MASDEYHEALLERVQDLQREIGTMSHREAVNFSYLISREMPEDALRMLVAEMLLDHWRRAQRTRRPGRPARD